MSDAERPLSEALGEILQKILSVKEESSGGSDTSSQEQQEKNSQNNIDVIEAEASKALRDFMDNGLHSFLT